MKLVRYKTSVAGSRNGKSYAFSPKEIDVLNDDMAAAYEKAEIVEIVSEKDLTAMELELTKELEVKAAEDMKFLAEQKARAATKAKEEKKPAPKAKAKRIKKANTEDLL